MVYKYIRKTQRANSWTEQEMNLALAEIRENKISLRGASTKYGIPYPTLSDHKKKNSSEKRLGRFRNVLTTDEENDFAEHLIKLDQRFYGLTKRDFCILAYEYADKNRIQNPFKNGCAGEQWYANFMKRHPEISLRTPEPTSVARACGFNKVQVGIFFDNLKHILEKYKIPLDNIYNVDETGIQTSAKKPPKVLSTKGKRQVGAIASTERGTLVTSLFCCSATGKFIPPALVFPRKKKNPRYLEGTPSGTLMMVTDNGWITSETFLEWLTFFVKSVRPTAEQKCLLVLDNHVSHRSLQVLDYASQNNVIILSVPPHTTHKLQPLDVSVYGPFSKYFERSLDKWQKAHPAQRVNFFDIGGIFAEAYLNSATPNNAINGFRKTGIATCDISIFTDIDFMPSEVTDTEIATTEDISTLPDSLGALEENLIQVPVNTISEEISLPGSSKVAKENLIQATEGLEIFNDRTNKWHQAVRNPCVINKYGGDETPEIQKENENIPPDSNKKKIIILSNISVIPKNIKKGTNKQKAQKSEILTSTPLREELRQKENNKKIVTPKFKKRLVADSTLKKGSNQKSKKLNVQLKKSNVDEPTNPRKFIFPRSPVVIKNPEENVPCLMCSELYSNSRPREIWIQCNICEGWAHKLCSDYVRGVFICDNCRAEVLSNRLKN